MESSFKDIGESSIFECTLAKSFLITARNRLRGIEYMELAKIFQFGHKTAQYPLLNSFGLCGTNHSLLLELVILVRKQ